jgi:hypothetical protein
MPKWRAGIEAGRKLFSTGDVRDFEEALALHEVVLKRIASDDKAARKGKKKKTSPPKYRWGDIDIVRADLAQNDSWKQACLSELLHRQGYMEKEDMRRLLAWKWAYGKYRPGKRKFEDCNTDDSVRNATKKAIETMKSNVLNGNCRSKDINIDSTITSAAEALMALPQVGPATATAILSSGFPSMCPFYADEAIESVGMFREPYTLIRYLEFATVLRSKAEELGSPKLDADSVARALWAVSKAMALGISSLSSKRANSTGANEGSCSRPSKRSKN